MKVITTKSVGVASPVLDGEGKTLTVETKYKGNLRKIIAHETVIHPSNTVIEVSDEDGKTLIAAGHAEDCTPLEEPLPRVAPEPSRPL